jgi:plasmid stabilization system protein ParE
LSYRLHPGAATDLAKAARFYRRNGGKALVSRFFNEFERVISLIQTNPKLGSFAEHGRQLFHLYGFPFSIIYKTIAGEILVLVVRHQSRDPDFGNERR